MSNVYQLKITINDIEPPIWRRIVIPSNITFAKLHKIIQAAFGWQDDHLFVNCGKNSLIGKRMIF